METGKFEIKEEELQDVFGGFYIGSDRYTKKEYAKVGITWEHNFWTKDRYILNGKEITQDEAEWYTMIHLAEGIVQETHFRPHN